MAPLAVRTELPAVSPAVVAHAAGDLRLDDVALAAPAADQAVVEVAFGGICGSDLHYWLHGAAGESVLKEPLVLGHEVVGTVVRAAADGSGPVPGTAVAVHPATPAPGAARYPEDRPNLSPGCTYLGSAARFPHTDGAFSRYVNLPTRMLRALPGDLDLRTAALIEPASVAWHAVARAGDVAGKTALVIGCGPIGALTVAVLKRAGARRIVAVDMHAKPLEIAAAVGATDILAAGETEAIAAVEADVVIESSGSSIFRADGLGVRIYMDPLVHGRQPPGAGVRHQGSRPGRHRGDGGAAAVGSAACPGFAGHHPGTRAPRLLPLQRRN